MRVALKRLFKALDTPIGERDPYDESVKPFPYVNGGLFAEDSEIPNFTDEIKFKLLFEVSQQTDWSQISPTIFGGIFESTLNPETRHSGGMHYTSPENIHKVIDPLFLDGLQEELDSIRSQEGVTPRKRKNALRRFRRKLASLKFLDPACGSGNFLTETYLSLRRLEDDVLSELNDGQVEMVLGDEPEEDAERITLSQFYGIEINDFAVRVARTALWIAQLQANNETDMLLDVSAEDFPLRDSANIVEANALRIDWNDILPASECNYIMGNPPFLGSSVRSKSQTDDLELVFNKEKKWGKCDYCVGWYKKSADYMLDTQCYAALVSTNSITQGEQVEPTWRRLFESGIVINFAYRTFVWDSEATDKAHVHCVIIGFSYTKAEKRVLFDSLGRAHSACNINGYLLDAPSVFVATRSKPIDSFHAKLTQGSKVVDGGNLILSESEANWFKKEYPEISDLIRPYVGGKELMNGKSRFCLWLKGVDPNRYSENEFIVERLNNVRQIRLSSPTKEFNNAAETPWLFVQDRQPSSDYLAAPKVSSQRRRYLPVGWLSPETIATDQLWISVDATLYDFGIISSLFHAAWMRAIAGRMKSDYRFAPVVYNNLVYPKANEKQKKLIESCAKDILDAREQYPELSLATLYDPDKFILFHELAKAHHELDAAVEEAYGVDFQGDEEKIVAHLFKLYAELAEGE